MSADGKIVIKCAIDDSDIKGQINLFANNLNAAKGKVREYQKNIKTLNDQMAGATKAQTKSLKSQIDAQTQFLNIAKEQVTEYATKYKQAIQGLVNSGATNKTMLGGMFNANVSNTNMPVLDFEGLISSGKVSADATLLIERYNQAMREAEATTEQANANMSASSSDFAQKEAVDYGAVEAEIQRLLNVQKSLADSIQQIRLAYQSGKISPENMGDAVQEVTRLAESYNECTKDIDTLYHSLDTVQQLEYAVMQMTPEQVASLNSESDAVTLLNNKLKDLSASNMTNNQLMKALQSNVVTVTSHMRAEEAQVRANAQAMRQSAREEAIANQVAKGRITGTLGLLGMINPAFTRLSYAVRQFARIGGMSFTDLQDKVIKFGKSLKALPPQIKLAMGSIAAVVGTATLSVLAMVKGMKLLLRATRSLMGVAMKAGKAFLNFYDFDQYFGSIDSMIEAYNELQAKELALESLMKSRMAATDGAVQSIKDLIVAEEEEGVVSKQLQTSALQQLAAYTTQTSSLETLLPVLNDYIVQMYGVNATEKQAESAAKLFGKAMKGQTETLRRAGYVTEAQAKEIKNAANETERAALLAKYMGERCANMNAILAQTNSGQQRKLANSMQEVQREFGQAASVLKSTFIPVATQVLAILARIASYAAAAASSIARLFGNTSKAAAAAVGQVEDVANAVDEAGSKKDNNTMGIDELNILNSDGGAEAGGGIDPALVEENTSLIDDMASSLDDLLAKIHDAYTAGLVLGTAMKDALTNIPWDDIKTKAYEAGQAIAEFANGVVDSGLIEQIGTTLGEAANTVVEFFLGIVENFDFASLGTSIANGLENFIKTFDWGRLGKLLGDTIIGLFDMVNNFLESFDWTTIGTAIADFLCGIDWLELLGQVVEFAINVLALIFIDLPVTIVSFLKTLVDNVADGISTYLETNMKETGNGIIGALLSGITDVLNTITSWIYNHVIVPIVSAFAKYFGVNSDELHDIGTQAIEGFFNGVKSFITNVSTWIRTNIVDPFVNAFKTLFDIHSPSRVMYEIGVFVIQGLFNGIKSLANSIKTIWQNIKTGAVQMITAMKTNIVSIVTTMKNSVISVFRSMWTGIKSIINTIIGGIETFANAIVRGINTVIGALNGLKIDVPDWVTEKWGIQSFGFSIPTLSEIAIPKLATGAVLPANNPFLAIVGDQTQGTNIEAPLETIQDAVALVLAPYLERLIAITESIDNKEFSVNLGDREIAEASVRGQRKMGYSLRKT